MKVLLLYRRFIVLTSGFDIRLWRIDRNTEPSSGRVVPTSKLSHGVFNVSLRSAYNLLSWNTALFIAGRFKGWCCTLFLLVNQASSRIFSIKFVSLRRGDRNLVGKFSDLFFFYYKPQLSFALLGWHQL